MNFPDFAAGLDDPCVTIYYQNGLRFLRKTAEMITILSSTTTDIHLAILRLFTKGNSSKIVIEL